MLQPKAKTIAFQGIVGSFSHRAAESFAEQLNGNEKTSFIPCQSFPQVFERIEAGESAYGAIPLENSSMGSITANYDLLGTHSHSIVQELFVPVHHNLIALPNTKIESIKEVYSHPAALEQCRKLFKENPHMKPIPHWDTSASVLLVKEKNDPRLAAIASEAAAKEHGLTIVLSGIEDYSHNSTRFVLITKDKSVKENLTFPCKVSLAVELPHQPGSLATFLKELADIGVNLTACKSRPIPELPWHYRFFLDMEITNVLQHRETTKLWHNFGDHIKLLGCYPIGDCHLPDETK